MPCVLSGTPHKYLRNPGCICSLAKLSLRGSWDVPGSREELVHPRTVVGPGIVSTDPGVREREHT